MLSIILATRGRPHLLLPTLRTTFRHMERDDTKLTVMVDADDAPTVAVVPQLERLDPRIKVVVSERPGGLGEKYNHGRRCSPGEVYLVHVDYAPHVTKGFDQKILDAAAMYPDGYAVVYNRNANLSFPGINAVTEKLAEAMGGIYPEGYPYWWVDHHLDSIARMIDRIVFVDVQIDTGARRETIEKPWTQGKRDTWFWALLFEARSGDRQALARAIIRLPDFDRTPAHKAILINNCPMILRHASMVNGGVRNDMGTPYDISADPWYGAVLQRGRERLEELVPGEVVAQVDAQFKAIRADWKAAARGKDQVQLAEGESGVGEVLSAA